MAAYRAWREYGTAANRAASEQATRYALLGAMYTGTWRNDPRWPWAMVGSNVYRNARQIVKQTGAIVDLYEQLVYQGDLSTDGKPLPDGTRGAIPIDPQTGGKASDEALLRAFHQGFAIWQWRQHMSLIPKTAAVFGDVLVELDDDYQRGVVMPNIVFPGYVPARDLELDHAGNVKRYAVEYDVTVEASRAFGGDVAAESYRFRKEVDGRGIWFYKDDRPFDYPGREREEENPYGFVPAVWCRHELAVGSNRGLGAFEKTIAQAVDLNGTLSAAIDYQRRIFGAPIGIKDDLGGSGNRRVTMPTGSRIEQATDLDETEQQRRDVAQIINLTKMGPNGDFVVIPFDVNATQAMIDFVYERLAAENPEAEWGSKVFGLTEATGPGMQRILSPIIGKVETVRKNHDPQMIKLCQMNTAIMGYRLNGGDIPADIVAARPDRYDAFRPFDLTSYGRGLLDATIPGRDVFPESQAEKAQWLAVAADLPPWGLRRLGLDDAEIAEIEGERQRQADEQLAAFSLAGAGSQQANDQEQNQQGDGQPQGEVQAPA